MGGERVAGGTGSDDSERGFPAKATARDEDVSVVPICDRNQNPRYGTRQVPWTPGLDTSPFRRGTPIGPNGQIPYRQGIWQGIFQNQLRLQTCVELTSFISGTYSKIPYRHPGREFAL